MFLQPSPEDGGVAPGSTTNEFTADQGASLTRTYREHIISSSPKAVPLETPPMPEIMADPPLPPCSLLLSESGIQESQSLGPDPSLSRARDARGRFAKGSSGNPHGRPRGIRNPRRRVPDLVARPLSPQALSKLLDRKPHLLRPLAMQLLPPPLAVDRSRRSVSGSICRRCARSRISGSCCPPFWRRLRAARSRPPRARASPGGCAPGCARSGASRGLKRQQAFARSVDGRG